MNPARANARERDRERTTRPRVEVEVASARERERVRDLERAQCGTSRVHMGALRVCTYTVYPYTTLRDQKHDNTRARLYVIYSRTCNTYSNTYESDTERHARDPDAPPGPTRVRDRRRPPFTRARSPRYARDDARDDANARGYFYRCEIAWARGCDGGARAMRRDEGRGGSMTMGTDD